jgi:hypothetical protein
VQNYIENQKTIFKKEVVSNEITSNFKELEKRISKLKNGNIPVEFDLSHIYEVGLDSSTTIYMVNQQNFDTSNKINYGLGAYKTETGLINPLIVQTTKVDSDLVELSYFDISYKLLLTVQVNTKTTSSEILFMLQNSGLEKQSEDYGSRVATCVGDAFSKNGWLSVGLFAISIYAPEVGLAVVGACMATEY